ncbi:MAG: bifunctional diaminohydroxyphosphoribosylaminopyrimidine deaminase/5-amino-6-(5-phosphoribosylamino)uracil reductase RibD [Candidatus Micrarchaeia archaeon]
MADRYMKLALALAKKADPAPNPRVGAVLVKSGKIIGTGYHKKAGMPHAEIEAINDAIRKGGGPDAVRGATIYVTLEPCSHRLKRTPPCTDSIIGYGIRKVVYAMDDPNPMVSGKTVLLEAGIEVEGPVAPKEASALGKEYISAMSRKPLVMIKMAMSADGKTATRSGDSKWISCPEERGLVARLRTEYDAVMVGAGTVTADDPKLTSRIRGGRDPVRIIIDGNLSIPPGSRVLHNPDGRTIVVACEKAPESRIRKIATATEAHVMVCGKDSVDFKSLLDALRGMGIRKILIEGGSELNAKAMEAGIVDKIMLIIAPKIIGGRDALGVIGGTGIGRMRDAIMLKNMKTKKIGTDLILEFDVSR